MFIYHKTLRISVVKACMGFEELKLIKTGYYYDYHLSAFISFFASTPNFLDDLHQSFFFSFLPSLLDNYVLKLCHPYVLLVLQQL